MIQWQQKMKDVISELLETMFFISVDFGSQHAGTVYCLESQICLARDMRCVGIHLRLTESFARAAAANFLGIDEEGVEWHDIEDVAKEMTNMIGGSYMLQMEGDRWSLGIPSAIRLTDGADDQVADGLPILYLDEAVGLIFLSEDGKVGC